MSRELAISAIAAAVLHVGVLIVISGTLLLGPRLASDRLAVEVLLAASEAAMEPSAEPSISDIEPLQTQSDVKRAAHATEPDVSLVDADLGEANLLIPSSARIPAPGRLWETGDPAPSDEPTSARRPAIATPELDFLEVEDVRTPAEVTLPPVPLEAELQSNSPNLDQRTAPRVKRNQPPAYPTAARRRGWEGVVELLVEVRVDGTVGRIEVRQSSGHRLLDDAAKSAARRWTFAPATAGGEPVVQWIHVPIEFELTDD